MSKRTQILRVGYTTEFSALAVEKARWFLSYMYFQEQRISVAQTTKCLVMHDRYLCAMSGALAFIVVGDVTDA